MSDGKVVFEITGNTSGINSALNSATNSIAQQTAKWTVLGQTAMNALVGAAKAGFNAIKDIAKIGFEYNAQMETYEVNFTTLLGSAEAAKAKMAELTDYAARTPFAMSDLADATQTMLAFGLTSEESALALKHLGDISLGDANKLSSLTLAFSQVSSAGKLAGQDLLQMINAGFNPLKVIAEETGVAYADLKAVMSGEKTSDDFQLRMEAARREVEELGVNASQSAIMLAQIGEDGMISADMVAAAMRIATSEGGAFYRALESASETTQGQVSTIQDSWNMLLGSVTGGIFDSMSADTLPQIIAWLDELNAAFDENGFEGLQGAMGGIFDQLSEIALNTGAGILTNIYNGLTGESTTTEQIKKLLTEIFGVAGDAVTGMKEIGLSVLQWIEEHGPLVGAAATIIGGGFAVMAVATYPLAATLVAAAGAIATFTTDWEAFAEKYPNLVATFESLTGLDFSTFTASIESCKTNVTAFYNDCVSPIVEGLNQLAGSDTSGLGGLLMKIIDFGSWFGGVGLVQHWTDIKAAVVNATTAVGEFFTQTIPAGWASFCKETGSFWTKHVAPPIDATSTAITSFLTQTVPDGWSKFCESVSSFWNDHVLTPINNAIAAVKQFFGIDTESDSGGTSDHPVDTDSPAGPDSEPTSTGRFAHWSEQAKDSARNFVKYWNEYEKGNEDRWDAMQDCLQKISKSEGASASDDFLASVLDLYSQFETGAVELPVSWFEGAEQSLQGELDGMHFSTTVNATIVPRLSSLERMDLFYGPPAAGGWSGLDHASGGIFNAATRFLGADGMHTFGESGTEVLLPLDALWRKMGLTFDQVFAANLSSLQYSIMPQIPAAAPASGFDEDRLCETIATAVKDAVSGLAVEMDKRKVGKMVAREVSHEIANEVNGRKWTA